MAMLTIDGCNMGTNNAHLTVQRVALDQLYLTVCMLQQSFWQDESAIHPYDWSIYHLSSTVQPPLRIPAKLGGSLQHRGALLQGHHHHLGLHGPNHLGLPPPTARITILSSSCFLRGCHSLTASMVARAFLSSFWCPPAARICIQARAFALPPRPGAHPGILNTKTPAAWGPGSPLYDPLVPHLGTFPATWLFLSLSCSVFPVYSRPSIPSTLTGLPLCKSLSGLLLLQSTR